MAVCEDNTLFAGILLEKKCKLSSGWRPDERRNSMNAMKLLSEPLTHFERPY